jgi:flavin reductase (NADH)
MSELTLNQREFRSAMANLSAAVSVITTDGVHGRAGITVSAACSVTDDPPTMLICVNRASRSHDIVLGNGRICVNVLAAHQQQLAMHFAGATNVPTADRFDEGSWDFDADGVPVLQGALACVIGRLVADEVHGSHSVLFAAVEKVTARDDGEALIYFQRRFHNLAEL